MGDQDKSTGDHIDELENDALIKSYNHFREQIYTHPNEAASIVGYLAPMNMARFASDFILDKTARILDAASGTGMVGEELKTQGFTNIDALDISRGALAYSEKLGVYTNYICDTLDDHQTQIPEDSYDAVLMVGAFGLPGHVTDACFPELIRITKTGGFIMISVGTLVIDQWKEKLEAAIEAVRKKGLWELVETRWCPYMKPSDEKAMVPILKITKGKI